MYRENNAHIKKVHSALNPNRYTGTKLTNYVLAMPRIFPVSSQF